MYIFNIKINARKMPSVTKLLRKVNVDVPEPVISGIPRVTRPHGISPSMFGSFVEHLVKYTSGIAPDIVFAEADSLLGLLSVADKLDHSAQLLHEQMSSARRRVSVLCPLTREILYDIAKLSTAHGLLCASTSANVTTLRRQAETFSVRILNLPDNELPLIVEFAHIVRDTVMGPYMSSDQSHNAVNVGVVSGVIDLIRDDPLEIIDIKCCAEDDPESWYKQTLVYACMFFLQYGRAPSRTIVWNFHTGNAMSFNVGNIADIAAHIVRNLSNDPQHITRCAVP